MRPDLCVGSRACTYVQQQFSQVLSSRQHQCEQQLEGRTAEAVISKSNTIILRGFFIFLLPSEAER